MFQWFMDNRPPVSTDEDSIDELLTRSVAEILPTKEGLKRELLSGRRLRIYIGTDATGTSLHLGHATNYMILERFRRLGHEVIFLIGDFTSRIGDPTDKQAARVPLTRGQVIENTKTWINQVRPIIKVDDPKNPVKIRYNHEWLSKLTFEEVLSLTSQFTVQHMLERDMFERRMKEGKPIHLHEFLYPVMQGYDSVAMDVDIELCGTDQTFNALAGRTLLRKLKNKEKFVFVTTLLENPKTGKKMMSKSEGTGVFLDASAEDMYGGIMAQPDENMRQLFIDTTTLPLEEIEEILQGSNPRDAKMRLAREIVAIYHDTNVANAAQENFVKAFQKGDVPDDVEVVVIDSDQLLIDVLAERGVVPSKTDFRRLVQAGAVTNKTTDKKVTDPNASAVPGVYKVGKHRFVEIKTK